VYGAAESFAYEPRDAPDMVGVRMRDDKRVYRLHVVLKRSAVRDIAHCLALQDTAIN